MAEKSLWSYLKKGMRPYWDHARRHEDSISTGTSDVSYYLNGNGWIELKEVKRRPARPRTGISLGQWHENSGAQRHFLIMRRGFLFIRVNYPERMYLLINHENLPPWEKEKRWNWNQFTDNALYIWVNRVDWEEFAEEIQL